MNDTLYSIHHKRHLPSTLYSIISKSKLQRTPAEQSYERRAHQNNEQEPHDPHGHIRPFRSLCISLGDRSKGSVLGVGYVVGLVLVYPASR